MRRLMLLALLLGLLGARWDGRPIVAKTLESKLYSTGDAVLVVEVAEGIFAEDLLGRTMIYEQGTGEHSEARIFFAQQSGANIRILVSILKGTAPTLGGGAIIL